MAGTCPQAPLLPPCCLRQCLLEQESRGGSSGVGRCLQAVQEFPTTPTPVVSWGPFSPFQFSETCLWRWTSYRRPAFWVVKTVAKTQWRFCHLQSPNIQPWQPQFLQSQFSLLFFFILHWSFFPSAFHSLSFLLLSFPLWHQYYILMLSSLSFPCLSHSSVHGHEDITSVTPVLLAVPWFLGLRSKKELCMN